MKNLFQLDSGFSKSDNESFKLNDLLTKRPKDLNVILTGVTGAVGSHVLFELLKKYADYKYNGKIVVLARPNSKTGHSAYHRVVNLISSEHAPDYIRDYYLNTLLSFIEVVECDLSDKSLGQKLAVYKDLENCHIIHSAATTNLAPNDKAYEENYRINYCGSLGLLNACKSFANKFTFISTAYSCGVQEGIIPNDYQSLDKEDFRNHYESIKAKLEVKLVEECNALDIEFQVLRPAIVCGRLLDAPLNRIANFSVFYAYGKFFYSARGRNSKDQVQIETFEEAGLHIIPVDYVAKVIVAAFTRNDIKALNIAPKERYMLNKMIPKVTGHMGYDNIKLVRALDTNEASNGTQKLYYKMVDSSFGRYIKAPNFEFDVAALEELLPGIEVPKAEDHIDNLLAFAVSNEFKALETVEMDHSKEQAIANAFVRIAL